MTIEQITDKSIELLTQLIKTPSVSRNEGDAVVVLRHHLKTFGIPYEAIQNNTCCRNKYWNDSKPVVLLNSHIDTVKPVAGWTYDPFGATVENGKLIGLGSNDAGAPLVSLLAVFAYFFEQKDLPFNLLFAPTVLEEVSGSDGMALLVKHLDKVDFAIVGEPTQMKLAVAEKGLMVLDCEVKGKAGHAARNEGINSIYLAMAEIEKVRNYHFEKVSSVLGEVKTTVTQINAGSQHNVVPDTCSFVMDVRTNECYTNKEVVNEISQLLNCKVVPRSLRLNSSGIDMDHPFVKRALANKIECYGSPTLSDQALMSYPSVKIGPGDSARSHTANEYIHFDEIRDGVKIYIELLDGLIL